MEILHNCVEFNEKMECPKHIQSNQTHSVITECHFSFERFLKSEIPAIAVIYICHWQCNPRLMNRLPDSLSLSLYLFITNHVVGSCVDKWIASLYFTINSRQILEITELNRMHPPSTYRYTKRPPLTSKRVFVGLKCWNLLQKFIFELVWLGSWHFFSLANLLQ